MESKHVASGSVEIVIWLFVSPPPYPYPYPYWGGGHL